MVEISCPTLSRATALQTLGSFLPGPSWMNANGNFRVSDSPNQADSLGSHFDWVGVSASSCLWARLGFLEPRGLLWVAGLLKGHLAPCKKLLIKGNSRTAFPLIVSPWKVWPTWGGLTWKTVDSGWWLSLFGKVVTRL